MFQIEWIVERVRNDEYYFSRHDDQERQNDDLTITEVEEALLSGRILEHYVDTGRGERCLVVGFTNEGKPVHIVCGERGEQLVLSLSMFLVLQNLKLLMREVRR